MSPSSDERSRDMVARITIDGRPFTGRSVAITNRGKVLIDGVEQEDALHGQVELHIIEGEIENLEVDGDVHCGSVSGNVEAFAEFKGYEGWQVINLSHSEKLLAVILGNPAMIDAYKAVIPANGKPVPDGAKMAKIHYVPKVREEIPGQPTVPGTLHDIDFMVKDSKRFADSGGWGYGVFEYDAASDTFRPGDENDKDA